MENDLKNVEKEVISVSGEIMFRNSCVVVLPGRMQSSLLVSGTSCEKLNVAN